MTAISPNYIAGETLYPKRFAKHSTTADKTALMADADSIPLGVIHEGSRIAPIPQVSAVEHAQAGEEARVHGEGEEVPVEIGASVSDGDMLMPDADGYAITATSGKYYGAQALQAGAAAGETILCRVTLGLLA